MSDTRVRSFNVAVDDTATLHYADATLTGVVTAVFRSGPLNGRVRKIAVAPVNAPTARAYFVPDRASNRWLSVGGATTLTF